MADMLSVACREESAMRMMKGNLSGYSRAAHKGRASEPKVLLPEPRKPMMSKRRSSSFSSRLLKKLNFACVILI
jgi:hypothetical protein